MADARRVFIDALNVAYWCGSPPSLRLPLSLMIQLLASGEQPLLFFDASAPYQLRHEAGIYASLRQHAACCIEVPAGRSADGVMLRQANASGACIVSRDRYRDYRSRYRKLIDDPSRLMAGSVEQERVRVAALALVAPLAATAEEAWKQLEPMLPK